MSDYQQKDGSGALFKNQKQKESQPDYRGNLRIAGVDYEVAGWIKKSAKGTTYMSLNAQLPRERKEAPPASAAAPYDDSDIPW